jgi:hypothetical protein
MEKEISVNQVVNAFANARTGVQVTLFRHKILLTKEEAVKLLQELSFVVEDIED